MLIRPARPEDALSVAHVHVRAWQAGYRHLLPDSYLAQLRPEQRASRYDFANTDAYRPKTLVALEGQAICGFVTTTPSRDADGHDCGELCALYVDPDYWRRGLGSALLCTARLRLAERGYRHATLWLLDGNHGGARLYAADGWAPDGAVRTEWIGGVELAEIRYRRSLKP